MTADLKPTFVSTKYFTGPGIKKQGTISAVADRIYAQLIDFGDGATVDSAGINVTTADVGTSARIGWYEKGADGTPGSLVEELGEVSVGSNGEAFVADGTERTRSLFLVAAFEGTPTCTRANGTTQVSYIGKASMSGDAVAYRATHVYGALPASFGSVTVIGHSPALMIKM